MKFLFDLFPVILFFVAFKFTDIYIATAVAIVATFLQIGWIWMRRRKVDGMLWVSLVVITVLAVWPDAAGERVRISQKPDQGDDGQADDAA